MADNPAEEVPPAAPADESAAPADKVAEEVAAPEEAPLAEVACIDETAKILVENEINEVPEEHPPADGKEQPLEVGEGGEKKAKGASQTDLNGRTSVIAAERKRIKLEKVKKMLDLDKAVQREALKAAEAEAARKKKIRGEEEGSHESFDLLESEDGAKSFDEFADLKAAINEFDNIEPIESAGSVDEAEESTSSEDTPRLRPQQSIKGTFLREFDSLPSISDISLDISFEECEAEPEQEQSDDEIGGGRFVDGVDVDAEDESVDSASDQNAATAADAIDDVEEETESEVSLMDDLPDEPEPAEKRVVIKEEEDTMAMFTDALEVIAPDIPEMVSVEEPFWYRLTADFLENLISTVVEKWEKAAFSELSLDKNKLIRGLFQEVEEYLFEQSRNIQINNIVCEYFRRNHKKAPFLQLLPEDAAQERERFQHALNVVDSLRERVKYMKINYNTNTNRAMLELTSLTVLSFNEEQRLERLMSSTLVRRDMERLRRVLDNELRRMQDMRNQISEKRYELNLNLHNLAFVDQKVANFEKITDTLTISQMLCANESVIHLEKQLEEKSKDVSFMQGNYKKSKIEETCIREKADMIAYLLEKAKLKYDDRLLRRNKLREQLTDLQWEHAQLKAQRARLEAKGGLLFKVPLMYDYDKCMEEVVEKRESIKKLKTRAADMSRHISALQAEIFASRKTVLHL